MSKIRVTQVKSQIGRLKNQKRTLEALGLRKINQTVDVKDALKIEMIAIARHISQINVKITPTFQLRNKVLDMLNQG